MKANIQFFLGVIVQWVVLLNKQEHELEEVVDEKGNRFKFYYEQVTTNISKANYVMSLKNKKNVYGIKLIITWNTFLVLFHTFFYFSHPYTPKIHIKVSSSRFINIGSLKVSLYVTASWKGSIIPNLDHPYLRSRVEYMRRILKLNFTEWSKLIDNRNS